MSTLLKVLLGMALILPLTAYVAGTLVASGADMPDQRAPIIIPSGSPAAKQDDPSPSTATPHRNTSPQGPSKGSTVPGEREVDGGVTVVKPAPRDLDADESDDRDEGFGEGGDEDDEDDDGADD